MPKCFKSFEETRVILDATEIPVEKPNCLKSVVSDKAIFNIVYCVFYKKLMPLKIP